MQASRGRPLTTSGSKFNQLAIPIIGLRLDRQPLRARWLALEPGIVNKFPRIHTWKPARFAHCSAIESSPKSCGQLLGESWPRAIRSGTGRGGDVTGSRVLLFPVIDRG